MPDHESKPKHAQRQHRKPQGGHTEEFYSAREQRQLVESIDEMGRPFTGPNRHWPVLRLLQIADELSESFPQDSHAVYYDREAADFVVTEPKETKKIIGDPLEVNYAALDFVVGLYLEQFGGWIPLGGGGNVHTVRFRILDVYPSTRSVRAEILSVIAGQTVAQQPAQIEGSPGQIYICDPAGCNFNEPEADLLDREGWATYMQPQPGEAPLCQPYADSDYNPPDPQWEVQVVCCPEGSCD